MPNAPETGYGYIRRGVALTDSAHTPYQVARFGGEAGPQRAQAYLRLRGVLLEQRHVYVPRQNTSPSSRFRRISSKPARPRSMPPITAATSSSVHTFLRIRTAVDYAVIENRRRGGGRSRCRLERRGSVRLWRSARKMAGNVLAATRGCTTAKALRSTATEAGAAIGVENLVIVSTKDAVLVNRQRPGREERWYHSRPAQRVKRHRDPSCGRCDVVVQTPRFNVNRITVKPAVLPMQMHQPPRRARGHSRRHRRVTVERQQSLLTEPVTSSDWRRHSLETRPHSAGSAEIQSGRAWRGRHTRIKTSIVVANFSDRRQ